MFSNNFKIVSKTLSTSSRSVKITDKRQISGRGFDSPHQHRLLNSLFNLEDEINSIFKEILPLTS